MQRGFVLRVKHILRSSCECFIETIYLATAGEPKYHQDANNLRLRRVDDKTSMAELVADIISAYVSKNTIEPGQLPTLIQSVYSSLSSADQPPRPAEDPVRTATAAEIRKSITPDGLISFVDGKSYKTLKRHLSAHGLTVDQYKAKFGLPRDYPTTAPSYSERRSAMARAVGLGSKGRGGVPDTAPAKRGRPPGSKKPPASLT
jgi:predicted transcriptional regulator